MDLASTVINGAVVTLVGLILAFLGKGRFEAQEQRIDRLEQRLDERMNGFQSSLDVMRSDINHSLDALRSDLAQVALAVGVRRRANNA
jgi:hypothetical protein